MVYGGGGGGCLGARVTWNFLDLTSLNDGFCNITWLVVISNNHQISQHSLSNAIPVVTDPDGIGWFGGDELELSVTQKLGAARDSSELAKSYKGRCFQWNVHGCPLNRGYVFLYF